jgi:hypothetical protein
MVLFLFSRLNDGNASFRCLLLLQYPQLTQPLNFLDEGILCVFFGTGKAQLWFCLKRDRLSFSVN